jgi:uncharacterized protein with HEPN domain
MQVKHWKWYREKIDRIWTTTGCWNFPWLQIVGMRHRLIHGYDAVDLDVLWDTIIDDLPPLIDELEKILLTQKKGD